MSRRRIRWFAVSVGVLITASVHAQEKKPNIMFIMGDDIGWMQPSSITAA